MRVLAVRPEQAANILGKLRTQGLVDPSVKITKRGHEVLISVLREPSFSLSDFAARWETEARLAPRASLRDPQRVLRERLQSSGIPLDLAPRRWKRVGDIVVLRLRPAAQEYAKEIGRIYGWVLKAQTVLEDRSGIHGPLRTPDVRVLWGDGTETVHVEAGVRYALDVAQVMFSAGNTEERSAIAGRIRPGAVVADLFAGIGYFTLPIAARGRAERIYACELNPTSYAYLVRNLRLNRVTNVVPLQGDCRLVMPHGVADWVILGHFDAREYLDVAFRVLRGRGTIVYHELGPKEQFPEAMTRRLASAARAHWMQVASIRTRIVKSYAPGIVHAAADVEVRPQARS